MARTKEKTTLNAKPSGAGRKSNPLPPVKKIRSSYKVNLPEGYTFNEAGEIMHKSVIERVEKLFKLADEADPDTESERLGFRFIRDANGYALIEVVHQTLSSIHTHVIKKRWVEAWYALQALTIFNLQMDYWTQIDDAELVIATDNAFAALLIKTLRSLQSATPPMLNEENFPDLEETLRIFAEWGEYMYKLGCDDSCYYRVIKGVGLKLFGSRTREERAMKREAERKAYEKFYKSLSEEQRARYIEPSKTKDEKENRSIDDEDGDVVSRDSWLEGAKLEDANLQDRTFKMARWKDYKAMIGPTEYITVWERS